MTFSFKNIRFTNPFNEDFHVIIYHPSESHLLKQCIPSNFTDQNFYVRDPFQFYLSPKIIFYFLFYLFYYISFFHRKNLRFFYELTLIKICKPKLVITLIDDDINFLSFPFFFGDETLFVSIQNGFRADWYLSSFAETLNSRIQYLPTPSNFYFFCFGQYEVDLYTKYFPNLPLIPVGSLRASCADKLTNYQTNYDICLILPIELFIFSECFRHEWSLFYSIDKESCISEIFFNNLQLLFNLQNYCSKYEKKLIIPTLALSQSREAQFLNTLFRHTPLIEIYCIDRRQHGLESYHFIQNSEVIIGTSTLMTEAFGTGKKVLQAEYTNHNFFTNILVPDINHLYSSSFTEFESKLNALFEISFDSYTQLVSDKSKYFLSASNNSTDTSIRSFIIQYLDSVC